MDRVVPGRMDEVGIDQRAQLAIELVLGQAGDTSQEVALGLTADGRRRLRQLEIDARGCQARKQRIAERGGYAKVGVVDRVEGQAAAIEAFGGPHELLEEQRHPVAPLDELLPFVGRQGRGLRHQPRHLLQLIAGERSELQTLEVRRRPRRVEAVACREHDDEARARVQQQRGDEVERRLVGPVHVVDEEDRRAALQVSADEPRRRVQGERAQTGGVDVRGRLDLRRRDLDGSREERKVGAVGVQGVQPRPELAEASGRLVVLGDAARRLEHRPEGVQARGLVIPRAAALGAVGARGVRRLHDEA